MTIEFKDAAISIYKSTGMNGQIQRRVFITVEDLNTIPEELFKIKISQSTNAALAGKPVFKYFTYKVNDESSFSPLAPEGTTTATPLADLKAAVVSKLGAIPGAKFSLAINIPGKFANINTASGPYTLFDNERFAENEGNPPAYLKAGVPVTVTLTESDSKYGKYYRVAFATSLSADDVFHKVGRAKVYGEDDDFTTSTSSSEESAGAIW